MLSSLGQGRESISPFPSLLWGHPSTPLLERGICLHFLETRVSPSLSPSGLTALGVNGSSEGHRGLVNSWSLHLLTFSQRLSF